MNEENRKELWSIIQQTGDRLKNKLPNRSNHPKGRNSYAHIALCIKEKFNLSYKDIPDDKLTEVIDYINFLKQNPS